MEKLEQHHEYTEGDLVRCKILIPRQDESPWDITGDTEGVVEKLNTDGSYIIAWEYGEKSTLRTHAWAYQIEKI